MRHQCAIRRSIAPGGGRYDSYRLKRAGETLLEGSEISLVDHGLLPYHDKDGIPRTDARLRWWNSTGRTLRDIAEARQHFNTGSGEPYPPLPEPEVPHHT